jgi:hypothetical protein
VGGYVMGNFLTPQDKGGAKKGRLSSAAPALGANLSVRGAGEDGYLAIGRTGGGGGIGTGLYTLKPFDFGGFSVIERSQDVTSDDDISGLLD